MNFYLDESNGSMKGGDPGIRLFEQTDKASASFFEPEAEPAGLQPGEWLIVPVHEIFGSEELSSVAPAVAERIPKPYLKMNAKDAAGIQKKENDVVSIELDLVKTDAFVRIDDSLPAGIAGLSVSLPGMSFFESGIGKLS
jgi:NADH-quinone oxidoreductase subunit G